MSVNKYFCTKAIVDDPMKADDSCGKCLMKINDVCFAGVIAEAEHIGIINIQKDLSIK